MRFRRVAIGALLGCLVATGFGQWEHRKLLEAYGQPLWGVPAHVNRAGVAAFTMAGPFGYEAFKNDQSLSASAGGVQGLAEAINEAGQVAWRGGSGVWVDTVKVSGDTPRGTGIPGVHRRHQRGGGSPVVRLPTSGRDGR